MCLTYVTDDCVLSLQVCELVKAYMYKLMYENTCHNIFNI